MSKLVCRTTLLLLFIFLPLSVQSQPLTPSERGKLDPQLQSVIARSLPHLGLAVHAPEAVPVENKPVTPGKQKEKEHYPVVVETDDADLLRTLSIQLGSTFPSFATARVTPEQLAALARMDAVEYVTVPRRAYPANDVAAGETGVKLLHRGGLNNTVYKGQGTLTCIIDTGIDWSHLDFREPNDTTRSRILSVWDQTLAPQDQEKTPAERGDGSFSGLDYGVEYTRSQIEDEIDSAPAGFVRSTDTDGHGTHVAGTVAGNGASLTPRRHVGMAPKSDIIVVKAGHFSFLMSNVVDGISYCESVADSHNKPVVVNMSLGSTEGPHDGTSPTARAVDSFVEAGKLAVVSAGNNGDVNMHHSTSITAGGGIDISFEVPSYRPQAGSANDDLKLDIWFDGAPDISVSVWYDTTVVASQPNAGSTTSSSDAGTVYINNRVDSENSDRNVQIQMYDESASQPPKQGTWKIRLMNSSSSSTEVHTWLYDHTLGSDTEVEMTDGDAMYTIGSPGTASKAITVGSYVHRWRWSDESGSPKVYATNTNRSDGISAFSSSGPRRDGLQKPDITAPGQGTASSLSQDAATSAARTLPGGKHFISQGTSMAAPVVSGIVALALQENSVLSRPELVTALARTARTDSYTGSTPNDTWGHGKLDAFKVLADVTNKSSDREILSYDEWGSELYLEVRSDKNYALKFTPTIDGQLPGTFIHTYRTVNLTDSLEVEVWTDDGSGRPDSQIGSTARIGPDAIDTYSWNYLDLSDTDVSLSKGSSYHLVFSPGTSSDTLTVFGDSESVDGRTSYAASYGWTTSGIDLRIRPEIAPQSAGANQPPVFASELADTTISASETLSFTYDAVDNDGDPIEYRLAKGPSDAAVSNRGELSWTPSSDDTGSHTIRVTATDGQIHVESHSAVVEVTSPNQPPGKVTTLTPTGGTLINIEGDPSQTLTVRWSEATDADGDELRYTWQLMPKADTTDIWYTSPAVTDTFLAVTYDTLASLLTDNGVRTGGSVDIYHKLIISDGTDHSTSSPVALTMDRGKMTDRKHEADLPSEFGLRANYPNPFNPSTTIPYTVPEESHVTVRIFDMLGQEIFRLADGRHAPGRYTATFDASELPSGVYFYRLEANSFLETRTMTLVK